MMNPEKLSCKKLIWNSSDIITLISTYMNMKQIYKNDVRFWDYVNNEMLTRGVNFGAVQCKIKWKELFKKYKDIKDQKKIKITWPYYKQMEDCEKNNLFSKKNTSKVNICYKQTQITSYFKKTL